MNVLGELHCVMLYCFGSLNISRTCKCSSAPYVFLFSKSLRLIVLFSDGTDFPSWCEATEFMYVYMYVRAYNIYI